MAKSVDEQIADLEAQIAKLKAEQDKLRLAQAPQYPKHIQVPAPPAEKEYTPTTTVVVNSAEEEKAALSGKLKSQALPESASEKLRIDEIRAKQVEDEKYKGKAVKGAKATKAPKAKKGKH